MKALSTAAIAAALTLSTHAIAQTHVEEVWDCALKEGNTLDEVSSINMKWIKYVNGQVKGGNIDSRIVTPLVGDMGSFIFVDSFPDLGKWAEVKKAMQSDAGQKIEAELEEVMSCTANRLYSSRR